MFTLGRTLYLMPSRSEIPLMFSKLVEEFQRSLMPNLATEAVHLLEPTDASKIILGTGKL